MRVQLDQALIYFLGFLGISCGSLLPPLCICQFHPLSGFPHRSKMAAAVLGVTSEYPLNIGREAFLSLHYGLYILALLG